MPLFSLPVYSTGFVEIFDIYSLTWNSIDWIYSALQNSSFSALTIKAYKFADFLLDNNFFFFYEVMLRLAVSLHGFELFAGSLLDFFLKNIIVKLELSENSFRKFIGLIDPNMCILFYPNVSFLSSQVENSFFLGNFSRFQLSVIDFVEKNSMLVPLHFCLQLVSVFIILFVFLTFFLSFFSLNREELLADVEYSAANLSAEAEKELFSIDDATCLFLLLFFVFASYFGFFAIVVDMNYVEFLTFFASLPFVALTLLLMPCNLIFDFGLLFVAYLRGVANTSSFFFELVYDYIGIAAFFTRLAVQFVRLILMFVVYCMMHDAVVLQVIPMRSQVYGDSFWDEICMVRPTLKSISWFFLLALPARMGYWVYEVLHTFFVVTVQFAAFFTIIFWLFLLFYTFFVYEQYEQHFNNLRKNVTFLENEIKKSKVS